MFFHTSWRVKRSSHVACRYTWLPLGVSVNEKSLFYYTTIHTHCYYERETPTFRLSVFIAVLYKKYWYLTIFLFKTSTLFSSFTAIFHDINLNHKSCFLKRQDVFFRPDGLRVDVDRGNALQKKFNHLQEWVGGLFGKRQLPSNLSLHTGETALINIYELICGL